MAQAIFPREACFFMSLLYTLDARYFSLLRSRQPFSSQSYGLRPERLGFSHGLNKCPPDTYLPGLCPGRPFESLLLRHEKSTRKGAFFVAEQQGFEPWRHVNALRDFESRLFDQLEYCSIFRTGLLYQPGG